MDRSNPRQAGIIRVHRRGNGVEPRHKPVHRRDASVNALKEALNFGTVAHGELTAAPLDKCCPPEKKSVVSTGEAEIAFTAFAQAPEVVHHGHDVSYLETNVNEKRTRSTKIAACSLYVSLYQ
jgi:hypothetical protein